MRPSLSLSIKQKNAPKILMKQLIKLLPLNDIQLEEVSKDSDGLIRMYNFFTGKLTERTRREDPMPTGKQCYDELKKIESKFLKDFP